MENSATSHTKSIGDRVHWKRRDRNSGVSQQTGIFPASAGNRVPTDLGNRRCIVGGADCGWNVRYYGAAAGETGNEEVVIYIPNQFRSIGCFPPAIEAHVKIVYNV